MENKKMNEAVRTMKAAGMPEKDAVLVSMKQSKKKQKEMSEPTTAGSYDDYPYGLRIDLNNESLDKLDIEELPKVGKSIMVTAEAMVESVSSRSTSRDKNDRSVCLQITKMKLG